MGNERKSSQYNVLNDVTSATDSDLAPQTGETVTSVTTTAQYDSLGRLTQLVEPQRGTHSYSYDGNGNLTSSTDGSSFTYNKKNQTTAIDGNSYTYSGPDQTERVAVNSTTDAYSGLGLSYETSGSSTTYYTRCSCGLLLNERLSSGSKYYYLFDGQGSIVGLTDSSGNEVNAYDYDPYGVLLNETTAQPNPFQYAGGYFESSTGLIKFGTRYYNPQLGRWTQQDPEAGSLANPDALNRYLYAGDDPVNIVDPSGRSCIGDLIGNIIALIGTVFDGSVALFGLLAVAAAGAATIPIILLISWILFPIVGIVTAWFFAKVLTECTGGDMSTFPV